ncbi:MAG: 23S rRNA (guanosine(2251)-2'-O)-methyltransferase RlmB [Epsilonproteobacteria bacterium]|nr:23S rRNA (guanosine(2251)-2'-O)-methyltransferase RlmB [Campylobacterota bacterium]
MIVYGKRVVEYIINKHPEIVKKILLAKKPAKNELKKIKNFNIEYIDNKTAQKLSKNANHQGYFAKIEFNPQKWDISGKRILILENITDMGNLGAITRSAYALGMDLMIITGIKELKWDRLIRTSTGAAIDMKILTFHNILELINILKTKNYFLIGADMQGDCKPQKKEKVALILGNEGEGLSNRVKQKLNQTLSIDMKREFDSLNVSVAAGILMDRIVNECI